MSDKPVKRSGRRPKLRRDRVTSYTLSVPFPVVDLLRRDRALQIRANAAAVAVLMREAGL